MTHKKICRVILFFALLAFFALTAFAQSITGGEGKITGLDPAKAYVAASVTLNSEGNGAKIGAYTAVDSSTNGLAGLYYVKEDGAEGNGTLVYVYGSAADRNALFKTPISKYGDLYVKTNDRTPGMFGYNGQHWEWASSWGSTRVTARITSSLTHFSTSNGGDKNTTTDGQRKEQWNTVIAANAANIKYTYTFTSDEIIPINEVESYTYGIAARWNNFKYTDHVVKFVANVIGKDGTLTSYEYLHTPASFSVSASGKEGTIDYLANANTKKIVDFTKKTSSSGEWKALPSEGYLVGFEVYPIYNMTDWSKVTIGGTVNNQPVLSLLVINDPANYVITLPKSNAPTGLSSKDGAITGFQSGKEYEFAPVTLGGDGTAITAAYKSLDSTTNKELVGLYAVRTKATATESASKDAYVWVEGEVLDRKTIGKINTADDSTYGKATDPRTLVGTSFEKETFTLPSRDTTIVSADYSAFLRLGGALSKCLSSGAMDKTALKTYLEGYSVKYAYAENEILPAKDLLKMKIAFANINWTVFNSLKVNPKIVFYVLLNNGSTSKVTWSANSAQTLKVLNGSSNFATYDVNAATVLSAIDGYVLGFEVFPWASVDLTNVSLNTTNASKTFYFATAIYRDDNYSVRLPKLDTPIGISAGDGKVVELDEDLSYTATPLTYIGETDNVVIIPKGNTEYTLTAGLWNIRACDTDGSYSPSDPVLVYIKGTATARRAIFKDITTTADLYVKGELAKGKFALSGGSWERENSWGSPRTALRVTSALTHFSTSNGGDKNTTTDDDRKTQFESVVAPLAPNVKYTYVLEEDEIVPISEVLSYTYGVAARWNNFTYKDLVVKFVAHVMDKDGKITSYEYLHTAANFISSASGKEKTYNYMNNATAKKTVDFTQKTSDSGAWTVELPTEGYFVGFDVYPIYNMTDWTKVTVGGTVNNHPVLSLFIVNEASNYEIYVPKMPAPTGLTVSDETVSGLNSEKTYVAVPFTVIGRDNDNKFVITPNSEGKYTFDSETHSGLWGICIKGDDYFDDSEPSELIYIKGSSDKRNDIGVISGSNTLADYDASKTGYVIGKFTGGVSDAGNTVTGAYRYLDQTIASSAVAQELWLHQNTKASAQAALDAVKKADAPGNEMQAAIDAFYNTEYEAMSPAQKAAAKLECQERAKESFLNNATLWYGYTSDEIIPVDELYEVNIGFIKHIGSIEVKGVQARFTLAIMDENGVVSEYSTLTDSYDYTANSEVRTITIDVTSIEGLPSDGYVVGFKVDHFAAFEAKNITSNPSSASRLTESNLSNRFHTPMQSFLFYTDKQYVIKEDAPTPVLASFPIFPGSLGSISGLDAKYLYEYKYSADGENFGDWQDIPAGSTSFKVSAVGQYMVRVRDTANYGKSEAATVQMLEYNGNPEELPYTEQISRIYLPNDFVELQAEYEIDVTVKNWVSSLALENIKTLSPESVITVCGEEYKFVVTASDIDTDRAVHYYDMRVSFDGESRFDTNYEMLKSLAGEGYVTDIYFESTHPLPFTSAKFIIKLDEKYTGCQLELQVYNERVDKLRKVETAFVLDGWVTFTSYAENYVVVIPE